jgi:hypothetical protein
MRVLSLILVLYALIQMIILPTHGQTAGVQAAGPFQERHWQLPLKVPSVTQQVDTPALKLERRHAILQRLQKKIAASVEKRKKAFKKLKQILYDAKISRRKANQKALDHLKLHGIGSKMGDKLCRRLAPNYSSQTFSVSRASDSQTCAILILRALTFIPRAVGAFLYPLVFLFDRDPAELLIEFLPYWRRRNFTVYIFLKQFEPLCVIPPTIRTDRSTGFPVYADPEIPEAAIPEKSLKRKRDAEVNDGARLLGDLTKKCGRAAPCMMTYVRDGETKPMIEVLKWCRKQLSDKPSKEERSNFVRNLHNNAVKTDIGGLCQEVGTPPTELKYDWTIGPPGQKLQVRILHRF